MYLYICKSAISFFCNMRAKIKPPALTEDVYQSCWHDFLICGPTIQPLTLELKPRPAEHPRQVNINRAVQLDTCFKSIIVHTPQCAIQHGMVVKALSVICGTWKVLSGTTPDKNLIYDVAVQMQQFAEVLRTLQNNNISNVSQTSGFREQERCARH